MSTPPVPAPTTLTREQLFEHVWASSAVDLSKKFGVSDVAISKACKRHGVPRPPPGYWAKRAAGRAEPRPKLPVVIDPKLQSITFTPQPPLIKPPPPPPAPGDLDAPPADPPTFRDQRIADAYARFMTVRPDLKVPASLRRPLPIVSSTVEALRRSLKPPHGRSRMADEFATPQRTGNEAALDICVSRANIQRAACFMNKLIEVLMLCGFEYERVGESYRRILTPRLFEVHCHMRLSEVTVRVAPPPKASTGTGSPKPKPTFVATGRLSLSLVDARGQYPRRAWADGKCRRIEDMLGEIVRGILEDVDAVLNQRRIAHELQRKDYEAARARWEAEERRRAEAARVEALLSEVRNWETARSIRRYRRVVERRLLARHGHIEEQSQAGRWLAWTARLADNFDPMIRKQGSG